MPIGWTGPRPEATTEKTQRQTKEENQAMRAARFEGQSLESLAVALQGKRPPPTPSPASKVTHWQEGPSKAAAIEKEPGETAGSESNPETPWLCSIRRGAEDAGRGRGHDGD